MRVLAVGNMYPPHHLGGYELIWHSAVDHLRRSGWDVRVLTTDVRVDPVDESVPESPDVHRELRWYWHDHRFPRLGPRARLALERHNAAVFDRHVEELRPDAVSWWALGGMSLSLLERARAAGLPASGVVCDDWMLYAHRVDAWMRVFLGRRRLARRAEQITGIPTRFDPAPVSWVFLSEAIERRALAAGWALPSREVAHRGPDRELYRPAEPQPWAWRLLYLGRIDPRKGIDTAVRALAALPSEATLRVVGGGDEAHLAELRALAAELGLGGRVSFERRPRAELPSVYAQADAVLFPVRWAEPWGLVPLEAMAVGRPVIATGTGGSAEYLRDGQNALVFGPAEDPQALAAAVRRLAGDPGLRDRLRRGGQETAEALDPSTFNEAVKAALERLAGRRTAAANAAGRR